MATPVARGVEVTHPGGVASCLLAGTPRNNSRAAVAFGSFAVAFGVRHTPPAALRGSYGEGKALAAGRGRSLRPCIPACTRKQGNAAQARQTRRRDRPGSEIETHKPTTTRVAGNGRRALEAGAWSNAAQRGLRRARPSSSCRRASMQRVWRTSRGPCRTPPRTRCCTDGPRGARDRHPAVAVRRP